MHKGLVSENEYKTYGNQLTNSFMIVRNSFILIFVMNIKITLKLSGII